MTAAHPALTGPAVADPLSGRALRRWVVETGNRHGGRGGLGEVLGDLYYATVTGVIGLAVALGSAQSLRSLLQPPAPDGVADGPGVASAVPWLLLAGLGLAVSLAGRLGPVGVGGAEATWLLGTPVDRRGLLRPTARRFPILAGVAAAVVVGILDAGLAADRDAGHVLRTTAAGALAAILTVLLAGVAQSAQVSRRRVALVGDLLVGLVPLAALVVTFAGGRLPTGVTVPSVGVAVLAVAVMAAAVLLDVRLGALGARTLRESGSVAAQAAGALVSLDSRELGRALTDATSRARRRRARRFRLVRGPATALLVADALVLTRSARHLVQLVVAAAVPIAVARTPELAGPGVFVVVVLVVGYIAMTATAEAARRAEMQPAVDRLLPLSDRTVRRLHMVVPGVAMLGWSLITYAAVGDWWGGGLGRWLVLGAAATPVWAAAAVRAAFRPQPNWGGPLVSSPMGALPGGVAAVVARGPDVAFLGHVPVVVALVIGATPPLLVMIQLAVSVVCVMVASSTDTRSWTEKIADASASTGGRS